MTPRLATVLFGIAWLINACFAADLCQAAESAVRKAVLVTGASSGIGRNIAERLADEGYFVYAGARKDRDLEALSAIDNIEGVRLDVTIQVDIDAAVDTVRAGKRGLHGIVNNAGVVTMGILAEADESELDFVFDVNVYGPYRIVKAFAPLIIESQGRIINISSMAGISAPPAFGIYSMSKYAVEALSASLAFEMGTVGVPVSVVEPGPYKSSAAASNCRRQRSRGNESKASLFGDLAAQIAAVCDGDIDSPFPEPHAVADAVMHALDAEQPHYRYLAVTDRRHAEGLLRAELKSAVELSSHGHTFEFTRDELVGMLDEVLGDVVRH